MIPKTQHIDLSALKDTVRRLETGRGHSRQSSPISLGISDIDKQLPWGGLARGGLHEVTGENAGFGFHAGLLRRAVGPGGRILWCRHAKVERETGLPYGPGLARFGLRAEQFLFVRAKDAIDVLWAMEEGLRTPGLAAVVGDGIMPDFTATRRLQLAAEATVIPAFVLPSSQNTAATSAALTRWRISAHFSHHHTKRMRWQADLRRCRGGSPKHWIIEWDEQALRFHLAQTLADRTTAANQRQSA